MQRYLSSGFGYKYFSSPFQGAIVAGFGDDIDLGFWFPTVYSYDESRTTSGWVSYVDPAGVLEPMTGYSVNFGSVSDPDTVDLAGEVTNGALSLTLYNNNNTYTQGFNLVGNPYPSAIDWEAASGWTKTNIDDAVYYFKASGTDQYGGTYSSYVNGISSDGIVSNIIPSMQGFLVHVSDGVYPVTGTLGTDNSVRVSDRTQYFAKSGSARNRDSSPLIRLNLMYTDDTASSDPMVIYMNDRSKHGFDRDLDARKLFNTDFNVPNLYIRLPGFDNLSINAIPAVEELPVRLPLGIKTNRIGEVSFRLSAMDSYYDNHHIDLYDSLAGIHHRLVKGSDYSVLLEAGEHHDRFFLELENQSVGFSEYPESDERFTVWSSNGLIRISLHDLDGKRGMLSLYGIDGRLHFRKEIAAMGEYEFEPPGTAGIYVVQYVSRRMVRTVKMYMGSL
jgi:hypothetical protein